MPTGHSRVCPRTLPCVLQSPDAVPPMPRRVVSEAVSVLRPPSQDGGAGPAFARSPAGVGLNVLHYCDALVERLALAKASFALTHRSVTLCSRGATTAQSTTTRGRGTPPPRSGAPS